MPVTPVRVDDVGGAVPILRTGLAHRCIWVKIVLRSAAEDTESPVRLNELSQPALSDLNLNGQWLQTGFAEVHSDLVPPWTLESRDRREALPLLVHQRVELSGEQIVRRIQCRLDKCIFFAKCWALSVSVQDLDKEHRKRVPATVTRRDEFVVLDSLFTGHLTFVDCISADGSRIGGNDWAVLISPVGNPLWTYVLGRLQLLQLFKSVCLVLLGMRLCVFRRARVKNDAGILREKGPSGYLRPIV